MELKLSNAFSSKENIAELFRRMYNNGTHIAAINKLKAATDKTDIATILCGNLLPFHNDKILDYSEDEKNKLVSVIFDVEGGRNLLIKEVASRIAMTHKQTGIGTDFEITLTVTEQQLARYFKFNLMPKLFIFDGNVFLGQSSHFMQIGTFSDTTIDAYTETYFVDADGIVNIKITKTDNKIVCNNEIMNEGITEGLKDAIISFTTSSNRIKLPFNKNILPPKKNKANTHIYFHKDSMYLVDVNELVILTSSKISADIGDMFIVMATEKMNLFDPDSTFIVHTSIENFETVFETDGIIVTPFTIIDAITENIKSIHDKKLSTGGDSFTIRGKSEIKRIENFVSSNMTKLSTLKSFRIVFISDNKLTVYNDSLMPCTIPVEYGDEIVTDGDGFLSNLKIANEYVEIYPDGSLTSDVVEISNIAANDYPEIPNNTLTDRKFYGTLTAADIKSLKEATKFATKNDKFRPVLNGVFIDSEYNKIVAADGFAIYTNSLSETSNITGSINIPTNVVNGLPIADCDIYGQKDGHNFTFNFGSGESISFNAISGKYPAWNNIIPAGSNDATIIFPIDLYINLAKKHRINTASVAKKTYLTITDKKFYFSAEYGDQISAALFHSTSGNLSDGLEFNFGCSAVNKLISAAKAHKEKTMNIKTYFKSKIVTVEIDNIKMVMSSK